MQIGLRHNQRLLIGCHCTLRANYLDGSERADLNLLLIVGERFLRQRNGTLLGSYVLVGVYQVPVDILDLGNSFDYLVAEGDVRDLAIIASDSNESGIQPRSKALQKMLGNRRAEARIQRWIESIKAAIRRLPIVLEANQEACAR